MHYYCGCRPSI